MIVLLGAILGACVGAFIALKRKGKMLDILQYGGSFAIAFACIALFINIAIVRNMLGM